MKSTSELIDQALEASSRRGVLALLSPRRPVLALPELQKLSRHLAALDEPRTPLRLAVLHTYTSDLLDPYLRFEALLQGFDVAVYHGPYGAVIQEAVAGSGLVQHKPEVTVLLMRWEDLDPAFAGPCHALEDGERDSLAASVRARLVDQLAAIRKAVGGHLLVTMLPPFHEPALGDYDVNSSASDASWRWRLKNDIATDLRTTLGSTTLLDLDESLATLGRDRFFDARWWYTSRFPFSPAAAQDLARRIVSVGTVLKRPRAKVIALDADNTLWGGIVGEDGLEGIALGPDYPGNVYVAFQRRLLDFQQRGFLLALCSKNNEADVLEVLRRHPHQVLREEHFAALRANWDPKPENLRSLAHELNLGLDAFVFVDDSDHECLATRQALPEVEVIQTPSRPLDIPHCLDQLPRLQILSLTDEDRNKTAMYEQERKRRDLAASVTDVDSYLRSLQMEMTVSVDDPRQVPRIAQLTQKTNQFTLTTRRYSEEEIARFVEADDWAVATFSLRDIFGDSGLVGVGLVRVAGDVGEIDSWLMSCRVIGRKAETAFLETVLGVLQQRGVTTAVAEYVPTAKNGLIATFLPDHGFTLRADGRYERSPIASVSPPTSLPITIHLTGGTPIVAR